MTKLLLTTLTILLGASIAWANPYANNPDIQKAQEMMQKMQNMTPEQQQQYIMQMQQNMMQAQSCFSQIDQQKMNALMARGQAVSNKIETMCKAGNVSAAEKYAMTEGTKMMNDPTVKQLQACSKDMMEKLKGKFPGVLDTSPDGAKGGSICDGYEG
ncbi:MAG: hypothetical protein MRY32_08445 [Rickettsiales bacterium]|nr:hypothetical protein [Rickettsiales bacterium]